MRVRLDILSTSFGGESNQLALCERWWRRDGSKRRRWCGSGDWRGLRSKSGRENGIDDFLWTGDERSAAENRGGRRKEGKRRRSDEERGDGGGRFGDVCCRTIRRERRRSNRNGGLALDPEHRARRDEWCDKVDSLLRQRNASIRRSPPLDRRIGCVHNRRLNDRRLILRPLQ